MHPSERARALPWDYMYDLIHSPQHPWSSLLKENVSLHVWSVHLWSSLLKENLSLVTYPYVPFWKRTWAFMYDLMDSPAHLWCSPSLVTYLMFSPSAFLKEVWASRKIYFSKLNLKLFFEREMWNEIKKYATPRREPGPEPGLTYSYPSLSLTCLLLLCAPP